ncbi:MAG: LytTR family transcriptional regulator DNA-binding domain-containing protein, partial [Oceanicaulis sp.]|nr:LytTR family transcriptional regulator DNA-binding domain-containing protein [Oceanicaulis sp.]
PPPPPPGGGGGPPAAVADARKEGGGRAVLTLTDGSEVPVSRSYYPALREAGWV